MATGRTHGRPDGRERNTCRAPPEDRRVRSARVVFPLFPRAGRDFLPLIFAGRHRRILRGLGRVCAEGHEKPCRLFHRIPPGYVVLGIAAWNEVAIAGSVLQQLNHGITTGALFIMVGMLDERAHTRDISAYGGLWTQAPASPRSSSCSCCPLWGYPALIISPGSF